jgi:O-6-methylguanine DNA methyltransferase
VHCLTLPTRMGPLVLAADESGLRHILFAIDDLAAEPEPGWIRAEPAQSGTTSSAWPGADAVAAEGAGPAQPPPVHPQLVLDAASQQLGLYFAAELQRFDLPLAPVGTDFQRQVWWALTAIPYGSTVSYGALAQRLGRPGAARAVGAANARNPLPIVMPCHRVVGADGSLTGFGGGLPAKRGLLQLEGASPPPGAVQLALL